MRCPACGFENASSKVLRRLRRIAEGQVFELRLRKRAGDQILR
jgi:hypothetical protein